MAHPNEQLTRTFYAEFARGNLAGVLAVCTDDVRFHIRGDNAIAGEYGREDFARLAMMLGQIAGPSLKMELEDVLADDTRGAAFLHDTFTRPDDGTAADVRLLHVFRFSGGRIASFEELPFDQQAFDEVWRPVHTERHVHEASSEPVYSIH